MGPASFETTAPLVTGSMAEAADPRPRLETDSSRSDGTFAAQWRQLPCHTCAQHHYVWRRRSCTRARLEGHADLGPIFHEIDFDRDLGNVRVENIAKYLESIQRK